MSDSEEDLSDLEIPTKKSKKKLSVERIYQKKTPLEHILLRPDTYIGSVEHVTQEMWVYDGEEEGMVLRNVTYVPGLYKIFDEILVNAADNKQRDKNMDTIKIEINPDDNKISIYNNGKGIPVVHHKVENMYVPSLIFGHLLTSSNYDDTEKKVVGGRNGYGAKLCNVFSTKFTAETSCKESAKKFSQTWKKNMKEASEPKIASASDKDYTKITFYPDLEKFRMTKLDRDIVALLSRRAYDVAGSTKGVKVFLNGKRLPVKNFKEYVQQYLKDKENENGEPLKSVYEEVNARWEIAVTLSDKGFQQVSFVNSIATTKGGRHVDYVTDHVVHKLIEVVKKKNKAGINVKPFQIKNHLWVFVNCLIENPTFDSQTKENMTLQPKNFGSKCIPTEKFLQSCLKVGIVESVMSWIKFKADSALAKTCHTKKHSKLKGIPKLEDANDAGTKNSIHCTLILTEGDSAKSLVVAGFGVIGRDLYGVFPLRGKMLNVREATHKQIMDNQEINNVVKIMGLQYKKKYESIEDLKTLRYGKLMIMTDQDQDGSHIKGLVVNFIHYNWPSLLKLPFLEEFITPIVKATKGNIVKSFYSLPEFEEWKAETSNWNQYKIKYYKGLGTSTTAEAKEYFSDLQRHRIAFKYEGITDDNAILLAFSKKMVEQRKDWLTSGMEIRKSRRELGLPELYLYEKDTRHVTYKDFINKELILFSNMDNERSIPSIMDGLKPGQRKVIFTCFKRNDKREVKVAQLAGSVGEHSAYHHGEASLMSTIINLAQNYVGSNNINLLQPIGQFGTRLQGGKDAASPRYIFTMLSPVARKIFSALDDPLYNYLYDDNLKIEPEYYVPILPMVLVNGAEGIGTGWSTKIPNYNPRELVENLKRMIDDRDPLPMQPWYKGFRGSIEQLDSQRFAVNGECAIIDEKTLEITELPLRTWTQTYKEATLEPMVHGTEKTPSFIMDYKEYHTEATVRFVINLPERNLEKAEDQGVHKTFKLQSSFTTTSMVLFDHNGVLKRYESPQEILEEFYNVRLDYYKKRKAYYEEMLEAEANKLMNQARFIIEKNDKVLVIENIRRKDFIAKLVERGYDSDPVKEWKKKAGIAIQEEKAELEEDDTRADEKYDFDYLLDMNMRSMLREKVNELLRKRDQKKEELNKLRASAPKDLWLEDLEAFLNELEAVERVEQEALESGKIIKPTKVSTKGKSAPRKVSDESKPAKNARRIEPRIDTEQYKKVLDAAKKNAAKKNGDIVKKPISTPEDSDDDLLNTPLRDRISGAFKKPEGDTINNDTLNDFENDDTNEQPNGHTSSEVSFPDNVSKAVKEKKPKAPRQKKEKAPKKEKAASKTAKKSEKKEKKNLKSAKKGKKKRNPWSESESDEDDEPSVSSFSDDDDDDKFVPKPKKRKFSEDESKSDDDVEALEPKTKTTWEDDNDSFVAPRETKLSSDEDEPIARPQESRPSWEEIMQIKPKDTTTTNTNRSNIFCLDEVEPAPSPKRNDFDDVRVSGSDSEYRSRSPSPKPKKKRKKAGSSDSDSDFAPSKKKKTKAVRKKK